jgi:hypothetical protein
LELIERLREEFPDLSPHTVVRCVSIVAHHPSSTALNVDALLRHTERIARARLTQLNELPGQLVGAPAEHPDPPAPHQRTGGDGRLGTSI